MALSFLTNSGNATSVKYFEIRLEESNLILRGNEDEAPSAILRGTLVLCLSEPLKVQDIHMRLRGESRIGFPTPQFARSGFGFVKQDRELWRKNWTFVNPSKSHSETLPAGNYEYPFEVILPGDIPESVEGLPDSWVIYRMKATIDRGLLATNLYARRHVRVIRTVDPSTLELSHAMSIENVWTNKLDYSISTPSKAIVFGCPVVINFTLIPQIKGLKIKKIVTELIESQDVHTDQVTQLRKEHHSTRVVTEDVFVPPEGTETEDVNGQDGYNFTRMIRIPKSLRQCLQSVEVAGIRIKHRLKFVVILRNPDDHISELRATLPIHIFISPSLPVNENNDLVNQAPQTIQGVEDLSHNAPPVYGEHQFDQLYSDVDPSGYMTPAVASGVNTPFNSQSRSGSTDNLASMTNLASSVSAAALHTHLTNMPSPGPSRLGQGRAGSSDTNTPADGSSDAVMEENTTNHRRNLSARNDYFTSSGAQSSSQHIELISTEDLCKVPSYGTALQTPAGTPFSENLPTYQNATSRPPSPPPPSIVSPVPEPTRTA